jgi:hypothetical protein
MIGTGMPYVFDEPADHNDGPEHELISHSIVLPKQSPIQVQYGALDGEDAQCPRLLEDEDSDLQVLFLSISLLDWYSVDVLAKIIWDHCRRCQ